MPNIRLLLLPMVLKQLLVFGFRFLLNDLQHCKQQQQEGCMGLGWGRMVWPWGVSHGLGSQSCYWDASTYLSTFMSLNTWTNSSDIDTAIKCGLTYFPGDMHFWTVEEEMPSVHYQISQEKSYYCSLKKSYTIFLVANDSSLVFKKFLFHHACEVSFLTTLRAAAIKSVSRTISLFTNCKRWKTLLFIFVTISF